MAMSLTSSGPPVWLAKDQGPAPLPLPSPAGEERSDDNSVTGGESCYSVDGEVEAASMINYSDNNVVGNSKTTSSTGNIGSTPGATVPVLKKSRKSGGFFAATRMHRTDASVDAGQLLNKLRRVIECVGGAGCDGFLVAYPLWDAFLRRSIDRILKSKAKRFPNLQVLEPVPVPHWGAFTPALANIIAAAQGRQANKLLFVSLEMIVNGTAVDALLHHLTDTTLVVGAELKGSHLFGDEEMPLFKPACNRRVDDVDSGGNWKKMETAASCEGGPTSKGRQDEQGFCHANHSTGTPQQQLADANNTSSSSSASSTDSSGQVPQEQDLPGTYEVTGANIPWNTCAVWDMEKLSMFGFPPVADGYSPGVEKGIEEVVAINVAQACLGRQNAEVKLVRILPRSRSTAVSPSARVAGGPAATPTSTGGPGAGEDDGEVVGEQEQDRHGGDINLHKDTSEAELKERSPSAASTAATTSDAKSVVASLVAEGKSPPLFQAAAVAVAPASQNLQSEFGGRVGAGVSALGPRQVSAAAKPAARGGPAFGTTALGATISSISTSATTTSTAPGPPVMLNDKKSTASSFSSKPQALLKAETSWNDDEDRFDDADPICTWDVFGDAWIELMRTGASRLLTRSVSHQITEEVGCNSLSMMGGGGAADLSPIKGSGVFPGFRGSYSKNLNMLDIREGPTDEAETDDLDMEATTFGAGNVKANLLVGEGPTSSPSTTTNHMLETSTTNHMLEVSGDQRQSKKAAQNLKQEEEQDLVAGEDSVSVDEDDLDSELFSLSLSLTTGTAGGSLGARAGGQDEVDATSASSAGQKTSMVNVQSFHTAVGHETPSSTPFTPGLFGNGTTSANAVSKTRKKQDLSLQLLEADLDLQVEEIHVHRVEEDGGDISASLARTVPGASPTLQVALGDPRAFSKDSSFASPLFAPNPMIKKKSGSPAGGAGFLAGAQGVSTSAQGTSAPAASGPAAPASPASPFEAKKTYLQSFHLDTGSKISSPKMNLASKEEQNHAFDASNTSGAGSSGVASDNEHGCQWSGMQEIASYQYLLDVDGPESHSASGASPDDRQAVLLGATALGTTKAPPQQNVGYGGPLARHGSVASMMSSADSEASRIVFGPTTRTTSRGLGGGGRHSASKDIRAGKQPPRALTSGKGGTSSNSSSCSNMLGELQNQLITAEGETASMSLAAPATASSTRKKTAEEERATKHEKHVKKCATKIARANTQMSLLQFLPPGVVQHLVHQCV